jgi:hypothetical protein
MPLARLPAPWLNFALNNARRSTMTVERSILLIVGVIALGSALLAAFHSQTWLWITGIMGAHLIQASFTGICPVVMAMKKMGLPTKSGFA